MNASELQQEVLRLRDRNHELLNDFAALKFQVADLREWRAEVRTQLEQLVQRCEELAAQLGEVVKADEIADAVAERMDTTRTLHLTFLQRVVAIGVGVCSVAAAVKVLAGL